MKRREAIKNIGLTTGFVIATPTVISLIQSCTTDTDKWVPVFLSEEEGLVLQQLVDVILPKDDLPSATDVNVPEFIDKYFNEVSDDEEQARMKKAFGELISLIKADYNEKIDKVTVENYQDLLDKHMLVKGQEDDERLSNPDSKDLTKSEFLNTIKWGTISTYKTTEQIGENVLAYDPIPVQYYCGDLEELTGGKSWSLGW